VPFWPLFEKRNFIGFLNYRLDGIELSGDLGAAKINHTATITLKLEQKKSMQ